MQNDIPAHPDAALFPMLPEDELQELADDIKRNGQQMPILVKDGEIIDGRNRYAACLLAGVDPVIEEFIGSDVRAFIVSANVNRRHMTKSSRAMAVAMLYPEPTRHKQAGSIYLKDRMDGVKDQYLSKARIVLRESEPLAQQVLSGAVSLPDAYQEAKIMAAKRDSVDSRLAKLEEKYPELATAVREEALTLAGAEAEAKERDERNRQRIAGLNEALRVLAGALRWIDNEAAIGRLSVFIRDELDSVEGAMSADDAEDLIDSIIHWANKLKEQTNG
jgi:predicted transcriptional regulator